MEQTQQRSWLNVQENNGLKRYSAPDRPGTMSSPVRSARIGHVYVVLSSFEHLASAQAVHNLKPSLLWKLTEGTNPCSKDLNWCGIVQIFRRIRTDDIYRPGRGMSLLCIDNKKLKLNVSSQWRSHFKMVVELLLFLNFCWEAIHIRREYTAIHYLNRVPCCTQLVITSSISFIAGIFRLSTQLKLRQSTLATFIFECSLPRKRCSHIFPWYGSSNRNESPVCRLSLGRLKYYAYFLHW